MAFRHDRIRLSHDAYLAREWGRRHAMPDRAENRCHVCGLPWSTCGFGAPGVLALRRPPERFYCTDHEAQGRAWRDATYGAPA